MLLRITCLVVALAPLPVMAQEGGNRLFGEAASTGSTSTTELANPTQTTPEMWFYLQEQKRLEDPKQIIRRKAQEEGAQRRQRIAARKWFGLSNMRPTVNPIPSMSSSYSPMWAGNHWDPYRWSGVSAPVRYVQAPTIVYAVPQSE